MATKISRAVYADMYGPTTGDKVRLADTELFIEVERDLTVLDRRPRADAREGDAVDLVVRPDHGAAVPHAHVRERARVVVVVRPTVVVARDALDLVRPAVHRSIAHDDEAACGIVR